MSEINHIANDILYGLPVAKSHIFTPSKAKTIEYNIIAGCENELN